MSIILLFFLFVINIFIETLWHPVSGSKAWASRGEHFESLPIQKADRGEQGSRCSGLRAVGSWSKCAGESLLSASGYRGQDLDLNLGT